MSPGQAFTRASQGICDSGTLAKLISLSSSMQIHRQKHLHSRQPLQALQGQKIFSWDIILQQVFQESVVKLQRNPRLVKATISSSISPAISGAWKRIKTLLCRVNQHKPTLRSLCIWVNQHTTNASSHKCPWPAWTFRSVRMLRHISCKIHFLAPPNRWCCNLQPPSPFANRF